MTDRAITDKEAEMSAKHALLGLLLDKPAYRYELGNRLQERLGPAWAINSGHLYQTIERLEKEGLIKHIDGTRQNRDDRHMFAITDDGAVEYERWFENDIGAAQLLRRPLLVKITLAGPERLRDTLRQIDAYELDCVVRLREISRQQDEISIGSLRVRADHVLLRLGLSADISHLEAELGWARHAREVVSRLLNQDAIWPSTRQRPSSSPKETHNRQDARQELFGRIAREQPSSFSPEPDQDD
jgi:DNA-binding PadR family transcriptional regulator